MEKKFDKYFIASLKRAAQDVSPLIRRREKLYEKMSEINAEIVEIEDQINGRDSYIKSKTGGYGVLDLVERVVENNVSKWVLRYPETIIPTEDSPVPHIDI